MDTAVEDVLAYQRAFPGADRFLVVLNFGTRPHLLDLEHAAPGATIAIATDQARWGPVGLSRLHLAGNEGLVLRLQAAP